MKVAFEHAGRTLAGRVAVPAGTARAAVVFLHGSGPADAAHWSAWADAFLHDGIASLSYDKPGVGVSEGDWTTQTFDDRADEAIAAVRFLSENVCEETTPVGVLGMSQGAWIGPHAATMSDDIAFVVALSGSAAGPREQDRFRVAHELRRDGFSREEIDAALLAWDTSDAIFRSGVDDEELVALVEQYRDEPWFRYFVFADPRLIPFGRLIWDYEPLPFLQRCRSPLLAIWGSSDALVDATASAPAFDRALNLAGNGDVRLVTIHGADHGLRLGGERPAELFEWITAWILGAMGRERAV